MSDAIEKIDRYIANAADFAQPICNKLRQLVHTAAPGIRESWKWSFPHFEHKGLVCSMAAFKQHVGFTFWKGKAMKDPYQIFTEGVGNTGMAGIKLSDVNDIPEKELLEYILEAIALNEAGVKTPQAPKKTKKELVIPGYFMEAVSKNKKALETFEGFSYSNKKDYVEWVSEAKREETRDKRLSTTVEWLSEGKIRNWKYINC